MTYVPSLVPVKPFLTVVTESALCLMTTLAADPSTCVARQFVQFHVEATVLGVQVTVTGWKEKIFKYENTEPEG